jgi:adenosine deaminase
MLTRELLVRLPKAELHVHLDSALRPETMVELARAARFTLPTTDPDELRRFMLVRDASSLEDYLARFEYTIPLLQTPEGIERVAHEMVEDAARDGVTFVNTSDVEPLVVLRYFGPEANPNAPALGAYKKNKF